MAEAHLTARDDILAAIRNRRVKSAPRPALYRAPAVDGDLAEQFAARARAIYAEVQILDSESDIAGAIASILRDKNLPARIHVPPASALTAHTGNLETLTTPPGPDDAALALVPFGIAETGTLVNAAGEGAPASWHFRAGLEIAVVHARDILPHMENVLAKLKQRGDLPNTINFVSGPSRTGDIEQTMELGAHGPKALAILIVRG